MVLFLLGNIHTCHLKYLGVEKEKKTILNSFQYSETILFHRQQLYSAFISKYTQYMYYPLILPCLPFQELGVVCKMSSGGSELINYRTNFSPGSIQKKD